MELSDLQRSTQDHPRHPEVRASKGERLRRWPSPSEARKSAHLRVTGNDAANTIGVSEIDGHRAGYKILSGLNIPYRNCWERRYEGGFIGGRRIERSFDGA